MKATLWITQWKLDTEADSEQIDKNLLCFVSGALWVLAP